MDAESQRWGNCDLHIEVEEGQGTALANETTCHFPFTYKGKLHTQCTTEGLPDGEDGHGKMWCYTNPEATRYGLCQQRVAGGTSLSGDTCTTRCTTDYSPRPWCYTSPAFDRWGICLFQENRADGSWVWV